MPGGLPYTQWAAEVRKKRGAENAKDNPDAPGEHHYIDLKKVRSVEGDVIRLDQTAEETKRRWPGEPVA